MVFGTSQKKCIIGEKLEQNRGSAFGFLSPNESVLIFRASNLFAKFHQNRIIIVIVGTPTDRQIDRRTLYDFIICPMQCYSNWTDNS